MKFKRCQCGSETFYMRQNVTGTIDYPVNIDGKPDGYVSYDNINYYDARKYYRCIECDKRAQEVQDDTKI